MVRDDAREEKEHGARGHGRAWGLILNAIQTILGRKKLQSGLYSKGCNLWRESPVGR